MEICIENLIKVSDGSYIAEAARCQLRERLVIIADLLLLGKDSGLASELVVRCSAEFLGLRIGADFYIPSDVFLGEFPRNSPRARIDQCSSPAPLLTSSK